MGFFIGLMARYQVSHQALHVFIVIGLLGGFTTFSSFSLDVVSLAQRGEMTNAAIYVTASVVLSVLALMAGLYVMRQV
jgi:CrcB protein